MLFGAALLLGYAQAFGDRELFRMLAPEQTRAAKRFVEEGLEMLGYLWLLFAAVEERWSTRASAYPSP